ncbi:MAG TPA: histone deacetylase [Candidatus Limnocylindrales bacterium]|nr:histone deacetylase [Candidatus Limnocylindrales bacterium]
MTVPLVLLHNPEQEEHRTAGHPERPERVTAILNAVARSELGVEPVRAPAVPAELVTRVHDPGYVAMLDRAAEGGGGYLDPDTYLAPGSMRAARTAAGAVVEGVTRVLDGSVAHAFAVVRPPGHHAEHARAMGFCLFNNVAVGVQAARARGIGRIAVVDFDVHHGNGTQHSFANDPDLLYVSSHQFPYYPGTGSPDEQSDHLLNLPLPAGSGDAAFLGAYRERADPLMRRFRPELILVSAGFDAHAHDPLAGLAVSTEGYEQIAELIVRWAREFASGRTVWALEGGYELRALGDSVVACLRVLAES